VRSRGQRLAEAMKTLFENEHLAAASHSEAGNAFSA